MHEEQRQIAHDRLQRAGIAAALFASPFTVTWLSGFAPQIVLGPEPAAGGPPLLWYRAGEYTLIVSDREKEPARKTGLPVVDYRSMTADEPLNGPRHLHEALRKLVGNNGKIGGRVGVEEQALPAFLRAALSSALWESGEFVGLDGYWNTARAVKTGEELEKLEGSFALAAAGQAEAAGLALDGMREIDVWVHVQAAVLREAGEQLALGNNCSVGRRSAGGGSAPGGDLIRRGDSLLLDISARKDGYWSGGTNTLYAGEPGREQKKMRQTVRDALDRAAALLRPGAICKEIDRVAREAVQAAGYPVYPHHTGHGVGVSGHEEPRIVPYNEMKLAEGMVVLLEPGIYLPGKDAVRLEIAYRVTAGGAEEISRHTVD